MQSQYKKPSEAAVLAFIEWAKQFYVEQDYESAETGSINGVTAWDFEPKQDPNNV